LFIVGSHRGRANIGDVTGVMLRPWRVDDAEALGEAIAANIEHLRPWMPWIASEPLSLDARRELIAAWQRGSDEGGDRVFGAFCDGAVVGGCGLHRRIGPGGAEVGYWVHVHHLRRGYATEMAATLTDMAFAAGDVDRVEIHHDRANVASAGVPRALGFELVSEKPDEITAPGEEGVECVWRITRAAWRGR
jgi:RimJ/RimL family protein N-acetyltransferase